MKKTIGFEIKRANEKKFMMHFPHSKVVVNLNMSPGYAYSKVALLC